MNCALDLFFIMKTRYKIIIIFSFIILILSLIISLIISSFMWSGPELEQTMASHCPELALRQSLGLDLDKMCF